MLPIADIVVGDRFRRDLGDLNSLAESIRAIGLLHPIVVATDRRLVVGRRRLEACRQLGWSEIPARILDPDDLLGAEHDENVLRKGFLPSEAVAIARALETRERERAKERQLEGLKHDKEAPRSGKFPGRSMGQTRDRLAACVGMSGRTLEKAIAVVEAAEREPQTFGQLVEHMNRTGKVHAAYRKVKAPGAPDGTTDSVKTGLRAIRAPASTLIAGVENLHRIIARGTALGPEERETIVGALHEVDQQIAAAVRDLLDDLGVRESGLDG